MESKQQDNRAHDLAMRIYVELVSRNTEVSAESVKLSASASNIASLSLKLAEAFLQAEEAALIAREPTKAHALQSDEIAKWSK